MSGIIVVIIIIAVIVVAVVGARIMGVGRGGRDGGRELRRRFGPEYDRLAEQSGDPKAAEEQLTERVRAHDTLTLRPLAPEERERFTRTWTNVQERFVDDPRGAAQQADQVIGGLLTAVGYPSDDHDRQLDLASVDHAQALSDYRQARELMQHATAITNGDAREADSSTGSSESSSNSVDAESTEALRQAILHYRVMFEDLMDGSASGAERVRAGR